MALPGLDSGVRVPYKSCGEIRREPGRIFEWRQDNGNAPSTQVARRTCIFVLHNATGEKLPLRPSMTSTLGSVKEEVSKLVMIPASNIRLSWRGHVLEDTRTLVSYGISNGHCIHFSCCRSATSETEGQPSPRRLMPLTICMVDDSDRPMLARLRVLARIYDKVLDVKLLLETQTGIDAGDMRLTIGGKTLPNENTLIECGVRDESAILKLICVFGTQDMTSVALQKNANLSVPGTAIETLEFSVIVKEVWPPGRYRHIGLTTDSTIRSLKEQLSAWSGIEPDKQMLLHRGRVLMDDLTASYYNLEGGAHLDLALVGGVKPKPVVRPPLHPGSSSPNKRRTVSNASDANAHFSGVLRSKQVAEKVDRKDIEPVAKDEPGFVGGSSVAPSMSEAKVHLDSSSELHIALPLHPMAIKSPKVNFADALDVTGVGIEASEISMIPSEEAHFVQKPQSREDVAADPSVPLEHLAEQNSQGIEEQMDSPQDEPGCLEVASNENEVTCANSVGSRILSTAEQVSTPTNVGDVVGDGSVQTVASDVGESAANESEVVMENTLPTTSDSKTFEVETESPANEGLVTSNTDCSEMKGAVNPLETRPEDTVVEGGSLSVEVPSCSSPTDLVEDRPCDTVAPLSPKLLVEEHVALSSATDLVEAPSCSSPTHLVEHRTDDMEHLRDDMVAPSSQKKMVEEHVAPSSSTNFVEPLASSLGEDQADAPSCPTVEDQADAPSCPTNLVEAPSSLSQTNLVEDRSNETVAEPSGNNDSKLLSSTNLAEDDILSQSSTEVVGVAEGDVEDAQ